MNRATEFAARMDISDVSTGDVPIDAKRSVTHIRPIAGLLGATLVECRLETGRQHQIRIHLSELGHPLVGECVYIRDYSGPRIEQFVRCFMRGRSDSRILEPQNAFCSSAAAR